MSCSNCVDVVACQKLQAGYLVKPIRESQLLDVLVTTMGKSQMEPAGHSNRQLSPSSRNLNILLAEDNVINQKIATRVLQNWGHTIEVAGTGKEVLAKMDQHQFDLVLMDIQMPEMDGFEATRVIRQRETGTGGHIPIVAITAHAMEGDHRRCLQAGMDGYVSKPLNLKELFNNIQKATHEPAGGPECGGDEQERNSWNDDSPRELDTQAVLDPSAFSCLDSSAESAGTIEEILMLFQSDTPEQLKRLKIAIENSDADRVKQISHYLKGSAMFIGGLRMAQACACLEAVGRSGDTPQFHNLFDNLESETAKVCRAVECRLAEITTTRQD